MLLETLSSNTNNTWWYNSITSLLEAWESRKKPVFDHANKRELSSKTEQRLWVDLKHWDVIEVQHWSTIAHGMVILAQTSKEESKILNLDNDLVWIDNIRIIWAWTSIFKFLAPYRTNQPETFDDFESRFEQRWNTSIKRNTIIRNGQEVEVTNDDYPETDTFPQHNWAKRDFINNCNIGWKLHICVSPDDIPEMYAYLQQADVNFKYLEWGDGVEKTFTIYTGSMKMTREVSKILSEVQHLLRKPSWCWIEREIEFSAWVYGRFCTATHYDEWRFRRYWVYGMDFLEPDNPKDNYLSKLNKWADRWWISLRDAEWKVHPWLQAQARATFVANSSVFWVYFHW